MPDKRAARKLANRLERERHGRCKYVNGKPVKPAARFAHGGQGPDAITVRKPKKMKNQYRWDETLKAMVKV